jgi:hypothetical protein
VAAGNMDMRSAPETGVDRMNYREVCPHEIRSRAVSTR